MKQNLRAVIIDDETNAREALANLLRLMNPDVEICGEAKNADLGIELIKEKNPNLVFLDIQMPGKSGFDLLASFEKVDFGVIFTTAYQEFAIRAFRFSAIDYLLKPIDPDELQAAVEKYKSRQASINPQQIAILQQQLDSPGTMRLVNRQKNDNQRIALPTAEGIHFVQMTEIIQCESLGSYTKFHLIKGPAIVVSRLLKEYEEILDNYYFFRVHQSNIVNLEHIKRYVKGDGGQVWMSDNTEIEVSRRRKDEFLALLSDFYVNSGKLK
ncbi:LytTR family DNA-binding domain-containing protein [Dyadobacter sp. CY356]|uniref:LytR/AlgR family response regulator transcription factor n=1 Tax=Dyadobacter sp. CY356 TaxID=2906442 RepID=UPI001F2B7845|nr:LytTR family DNA-binding domain-containing protein [Dyadobacter sp. CY356]MCF0054940.1 LytTR family DNA-binding domain-containing protein [Dyadobacter sp. CY356]